MSSLHCPGGHNDFLPVPEAILPSIHQNPLMGGQGNGHPTTVELGRALSCGEGSARLDRLVATARSGVAAIDRWAELLHEAGLCDDESETGGKDKIVVVGEYSYHHILFSRLHGARAALRGNPGGLRQTGAARSVSPARRAAAASAGGAASARGRAVRPPLEPGGRRGAGRAASANGRGGPQGRERIRRDCGPASQLGNAKGSRQ